MAVRHFPTTVLVCGLTLLAVCAALATTRFARLWSRPAAVPPVQLATQKITESEDAPSAGLDADEKKLLWDIEHHGNLLNRFGFKVLADALARADVPAMTELFAPDFCGQIPVSTQNFSVSRDFAEISRERVEGQKYAPLDRVNFIARLMDYRLHFGQPPRVEMKLIKLAPEIRTDFTSPWNGSCALRISGEMGPGQPGEIGLQLQYQLVQPTEENLKKGGWLRSARISESLTARAPHYLMHDVTAERGIDAGLFLDNWYVPPDRRQPNTGGVYLCDYDRDGILDLLIVDVNRIVLYKGLPGGKFQDVTALVGLPQQSSPDTEGLATAFVDVDGDGWEDLFLGGRLYRNEPIVGARSGDHAQTKSGDHGPTKSGDHAPTRRFVDYTARTNLRLRRGCTGVAIADYDRDGLADLYVCYGGRPKGSSWIEGTAAESLGNQLWRNKGNWQFEDVTQAAGAAAGSRSTFTAIWLDANNDGWPDLHVINEFGPGVLLINQGNGKFREHLLARGPNDFGSMGATAGDIDNDGNIDLYIANMYSKAGTRVIGNVCPGTYPEPIMATMRQFVAGSQLWRNKGVPGSTHDSPPTPDHSPGTPEFEPLGKEYGVAAVGWAWGATLVDLDNDGWLDLYATAGFVSQSRNEPDG
jgi:FG-GAP-like repeat